MTETAEWDVLVTPWHLDEPLPGFPVPVGATEVVAAGPASGSVPDRMSGRHRATYDAVARTTRPLVLSGDCPTARATVAGIQHRHDDLAVVWLDAHGDFNTPALSTSGYVGGMAMAMLTGATPGLFDDPLGLRPVPEDRVVLAGARDLDPAERDALAASRVHRVPARPEALVAALERLGGGPTYLHLDIDLVDDGQLAGVRFPSGAGPSLGEVEDCLSAVCAGSDVVAAYLACAWLPEHVADERTRTTIARLARALGADLAWP